MARTRGDSRRAGVARLFADRARYAGREIPCGEPHFSRGAGLEHGAIGSRACERFEQRIRASSVSRNFSGRVQPRTGLTGQTAEEGVCAEQRPSDTPDPRDDQAHMSMPVSAGVPPSRLLQARAGYSIAGQFSARRVPPSAPFRSPGMVLQRRIHRLPRQPVFKPDLATWRKAIRLVEGRAGDLDLRGSVVGFVADRRSADRAEGAGDCGRRAKTAKLLRPLQKLEITAIEDGPRRRGRAGREPATAAMTPTQGQWRSADAEPCGAA